MTLQRNTGLKRKPMKRTAPKRDWCDAGPTNETRWRVFERDGYKCLWCGYKYDLTADHIEPRSKGGSHGMENLQTLCRSCNALKNDHHTGPNPVWVLPIITVEGTRGSVVKQIAAFDLDDYRHALLTEASRKPVRRHRVDQLLGHARRRGFGGDLLHFEQLLMQV